MPPLIGDETMYHMVIAEEVAAWICDGKAKQSWQEFTAHLTLVGRDVANRALQSIIRAGVIDLEIEKDNYWYDNYAGSVPSHYYVWSTPEHEVRAIAESGVQ